MTVVVLTVDQRGSRRTARPGPRRARPRSPTCPLLLPVRAHRRRRVPGRARRPGRAPPRASSGCCATTPGTSASGSARSRSRCPTTPAPAAARRTSTPGDAVTAAKNSPWHLRVAGDDPGARDLETALWLWAAVLARRTARGWEVADLVDAGPVVRRGRRSASASASPRSASAPRPPGSSRVAAPASWSPTSPPACSGRMADRERRQLRQLVLVLLARALRRAPARWAGPAAAPDLGAALAGAAARGRRRSPRRRPSRLDARTRARPPLIVALAGALAVAGGGPVTARSSTLVDGGHDAPRDSMDRPARCCAAAPGSARSSGPPSSPPWSPAGPRARVVLGAQGPGPLPRARATRSRTGAAERFIIGTFTSVLWAAACAGVVAAALSAYSRLTMRTPRGRRSRSALNAPLQPQLDQLLQLLADD